MVMLKYFKLLFSERHFLKVISCQELPEEGVKIFQGMLHSHLLGTSIVVRHIRDGQELSIIVKGEYAGAVISPAAFLNYPSQ